MIDAFVKYIQSERRYSPLTVRNYQHDIESFVSWCTENTISDQDQFDFTKVATEDIREWIIYRSTTCKIGAASINRELSSLRSFYKFLRKQGVVSQDIFGKITSLRTPRRLPTFVPETRMASLLDNLREHSQRGDFVEQRNALIISLFYGCGIRLAELLNIHIGDISSDMRTLHIRGKGDKHRMVPIISEAAVRIDAYIKRLEEMKVSTCRDAPLIVTENGAPLSRSTVQRIVARELNDANVQGKKSPHVLRHTFATHLLNKEADMRDIQELMGHSSLRTTQCYTHNSIGQLQKAYKRAHQHR